MTPEPEAILAQARARGVDVFLTEAGGLELLSAGAPPPDIVTLIKAAKPEIVSRLAMEARMIDRWVANHLIDWDPNSCLHCRQRILVGQQWIDVVNEDERRARFHKECLPAWRAEQEIAARRTIGLPQQTHGKESGHARE